MIQARAGFKETRLQLRCLTVVTITIDPQPDFNEYVTQLESRAAAKRANNLADTRVKKDQSGLDW